MCWFVFVFKIIISELRFASSYTYIKRSLKDFKTLAVRKCLTNIAV